MSAKGTAGNIVVEGAKRIVRDNLEILFDHGVTDAEAYDFVEDVFVTWTMRTKLPIGEDERGGSQDRGLRGSEEAPGYSGG